MELTNRLLPPGRYEFRLAKIADADTFTGDVMVDTAALNIRLQLAVRLTIRAWGYDACETTRRRQTVTVTDEEIRVGKLARDLLEQIAQGVLDVEPTGQVDPYGRTVAKCFFRTGMGLAEWARANRFTRETFGR
jgi:endonuclease YncB( thermonuclease family)